MQVDGIEGKVAFVTGGARGIGRCISETLRDLGAAKFCKVNTLIMGGDLTGNAVVAMSHETDSSYTARFLSENRRVGS
jgi:NAD(P)-dependent dehydrogenase (short-subunit alcohol dehydrogenase family)